MAVVETRYEHVVIGDDGVPLIATINQDIQRRSEDVERIRSAEAPSPLVARLRAQGLLAKASEVEEIVNRVEYLPL